MEKVSTKSGFWPFVIVTFLWSWGFWLYPLFSLLEQGIAFPMIGTQIPDLSAAGGLERLFITIGVFGPLVGAIVATLYVDGRQGLAHLARQIGRFWVNPRWYAQAFLFSLLIIGIPFLIAYVRGQLSLPQIGVRAVFYLLLLQALISGLGQEPGFRGVLLPELLQRFSASGAVWVLAILWILWHLPVTLFHNLIELARLQATGVLLKLSITLIGQFFYSVGLTYLYVWLYRNTRSLFLIILFHAMNNTLFYLLLDSSPFYLSIVTAMIPWLIVFVYQKVLFRAKKDQSQIPTQG